VRLALCQNQKRESLGKQKEKGPRVRTFLTSGDGISKSVRHQPELSIVVQIVALHDLSSVLAGNCR